MEFSTQSRKLLRNCCRVDGQVVPSHFIPRVGQTLTIPLPDDPPSPIKPVAGKVCILYEDEHLMVIDKAPSVPVHPGPEHHEDTLGNYVTHHYQQKGEAHLFRPVNRLDKSTSGLMVVAKHTYAADRLRSQLHSKTFRRSYLALCEGRPDPSEGTIDAPIARREGSVIARCVDPTGKPALTHYRVVNNYVNLSLVEVHPETGRTHQIRVHMAHIGHPLAGDFLYGTEGSFGLPRAALHSHKLECAHPITGTLLSFTSPLPPDMAALIETEKPPT